MHFNQSNRALIGAAYSLVLVLTGLIYGSADIDMRLYGSERQLLGHLSSVSLTKVPPVLAKTRSANLSPEAPSKHLTATSDSLTERSAMRDINVTMHPSVAPINEDPTIAPSVQLDDPTGVPSSSPTRIPTLDPSSTLSMAPISEDPTIAPRVQLDDPTGVPSSSPTGIPTPVFRSWQSQAPSMAVGEISGDKRRYVEVDVNYILAAALLVVILLALRFCFRKKDAFSKFQAQVSTFSENIAYATVPVSTEGEEPRPRDLLSPRQVELSRFQRMGTSDAYPAPLLNTSKGTRRTPLSVDEESSRGVLRAQKQPLIGGVDEVDI